MDDDLKAWKGCLAHLYGVHFDTRADCVSSVKSIGQIANDVELAKYQVTLYALADKYLMKTSVKGPRLFWQVCWKP